MIDKLPRSHDGLLAFSVSGDITREDYDVLVPAVDAQVSANGSVRILLDLTDLRWEKVEAWGADLRFGREFREEIERLAIIGHKKWERWLTRLAEPFYAKEAEYFDDLEAGWTWLGQ